MPCRDYYDEHPEEYYADTIAGLRKQVSFAESALCQTLVAFEKFVNDVQGIVDIDTLGLIDYKEAGITRSQLEKWWADHKRKDADSRRNREVQEKRKAALAKLTDEERKLLGIKG